MTRVVCALLALAGSLTVAVGDGLGTSPASATESAVAGASCETSQLASVGGAPDGKPVLLVHGMSGSPAIFADSEIGGGASLETQIENLSDTHVWTFDYSKVALDWVTNPEIGPALAKSIDCLAHATGSPVIMVDHSMGGLATQLAAAQPDPSGGSTAGHIAAVITIGTPFEGSEFLSAVQELVSKGAVTGVLSGDPELVAAAEALLSACAGSGQAALEEGIDDNPCDMTSLSVLRSPVGTALEYGSQQIAKLPAWPVGLPVYDTAGDIVWQIGLGPLKYTVAHVGDVLVTEGSATAHDTVSSPAITTCDEVDLSVLFSVGGRLSDCYHGKLPSNRTIDAAVLAVIKDALKPGGLLPSDAQATAELAQLTPGMQSDIVAVPAGYDAATWDQAGNIDFWQLIGAGGWTNLKRSTYPVLGTPDATVHGALLSNMTSATFIMDGQFSGDGTANALVYGPGSAGYGVLAGSGSTLTSTGQGLSEGDVSGLGAALDFEALFQGDQLTTELNSGAFDNAFAAGFPTAWHWRWSGNNFQQVSNNIVTAQTATEPQLSDVPIPSASPPDGTYAVSIVGATPTYTTPVESGQSISTLNFSVYPLCNNLQTTCSGSSEYTLSVPTSTPTIYPEDEPAGDQNTIRYITGPAWPLAGFIENLALGIWNAPQEWDQSAQTSWYIPSAVALPNSTLEVAANAPAEVTFSGGKATSIFVYDPLGNDSNAPGAGNTPPPTPSTNTGTTGSSSNEGTSGSTGSTGNTG